MQNKSTWLEGTHGAPEKFKGKALIGFIDLLGFSNRVLSQWETNSEVLIETLFSIKNFTEHSQHTTISNPNPPERTYFPHGRTLSDSILLAIALPETEQDLEHDRKVSTWCMFNVVNSVVQKCIEVGFPVRGALEFGDIYWNKRDVIGPALIRAYTIESNLCKIARILVGPGFLNYMPYEDKIWRQELYKCSDGLLALRPFGQYGSIPTSRIEAMVDNCQGNSHYEAKYTDLLEFARKGNPFLSPSSSDVKACIKIWKENAAGKTKKNV